MALLFSPVLKPSAYWDRTDKVVRDWRTGHILPNYEGQCMVYSDMRGPLLMDTFLDRGQRQFKEPKKGLLTD
ncbi:MAG TPA: hypothetical protein VHA33_13190 [Candidatus Angelobacter sp.]|jgi:hypothetical protein|nr:hypothetical protein [Candidatus Angelobacter sp.]